MQRVLSLGAGLNSAIVSVLRAYGEVYIDFLAHALGRRPPEILESLQDLERKGVIDRKGEKVSLASESPNLSPASPASSSRPNLI